MKPRDIPLLLLFTGCGDTKKPRFTEEQLAEIPIAVEQSLPAPSGGFVLSVGGETITSAEIVRPLVKQFQPYAQANDYQQFQRMAGPQVEKFVVSRISDILLYNEAKKELGDKIEDALNKAVEGEVRKFIISQPRIMPTMA